MGSVTDPEPKESHDVTRVEEVNQGPTTNDQTALIHDGEWDNLIVLDACRYDHFASLVPAYLDGTLRKVTSPVDPKHGYATSTWCNGTFTGTYDDVTYISTTLRINSRLAIDGFHAGDHFDTVVDLWETGWNEEYGTVLPETVNQAALRERNRDHTEKLIVHYSQPHFPYLSLDPPDAVKDNQPERRTTLKFQARATVGAKVRHMLGDERARTLLQALGVPPLNPMDEVLRKHGPETMETVYKENLSRVLEALATLTGELSGTTIVTADHGELLGEAGYYGHSYVPAHEKVTTVPWFEVESSVEPP